MIRVTSRAPRVLRRAARSSHLPAPRAAGLPHLFTTRHFPGVARPHRVPPAVRRPRRAAPGRPRARRRARVRAAGARRRRAPGAERRRLGRARRTCSSPIGRGCRSAIFTADCLPLVLYDPRAAAWRSRTRAGAARCSRRRAPRSRPWSRPAARPDDLVVAIGPSIGPCCYEVDEPVHRAAGGGVPGRLGAWVTPRDRASGCSICGGPTRTSSPTAGVDPARIDNLRLCTACRPDLFFSYRRERRGPAVAAGGAARRAAASRGPATA